MSKNIIQLNEEAVKGELKELVSVTGAASLRMSAFW